MKFTEKQFKQLVAIQEEQYPANLYLHSKDEFRDFGQVIYANDENLYYFISEYKLYNEAIALMNPVTRELVHEKYVDDEKRYIWTSKAPVVDVYYRRLYRASAGFIAGVQIIKDEHDKDGAQAKNVDEHLTVAEIREYGYDPNWFDAVEVK